MRDNSDLINIGNQFPKLVRDLAVRFNISEKVVSDIIITWVNFLYLILESLPTWPSREQIKQYFPEVFKGEFEDIRCIINCTEIKCQTLQDLEKQSELYSKGKSHNTFKGLVGISHNVWITMSVAYMEEVSWIRRL